MSLELTVKKLQKAVEALPEGARSPELTGQLECLRGAQEAAALLEEAAAGMPQAIQDWPAALRRPPWRHSPALFHGLVRLLQAVGTGMEACSGIHLGAAKEVLLSSALYPIAGHASEEPGSIQLYLPVAEEEASMPSTALLQLLLAGALLTLERDSGGAFHYLSRAINLLWPPTDAAMMERGQQMARRRWVPEWPAAAGDANGGAPAALPAPTPSRHARALAADLAAHSPDVGLVQLQRWARMLRLNACCALTQPPNPAQPITVAHQHLLLDCQLLLEGAPLGGKPAAAMLGTQVVLLSGSWEGWGRLRASALDELFDGTVAAAEEEQRWLVVAQVAMQAASWSIDFGAMQAQPGAHRPQLRAPTAALMARLRSLTGKARAALEALKGGKWVSKGMRRGLEDSLSHQEHDMAVLARGGSLTASPNPASFHQTEHEPCSFCGGRPPVLRACSVCKSRQYCSKDCQQKTGGWATSKSARS